MANASGWGALRSRTSNLFQRYAWLEQEHDDVLALIEALAKLVAAGASPAAPSRTEGGNGQQHTPASQGRRMAPRAARQWIGGGNL